MSPATDGHAVHWATLVADENGTVDYVRVRQLVSILLSLGGGLAMLVAVAIELFADRELHMDALLFAGGALVVPLMTGRIADGIGARLAEGKAAKARLSVAVDQPDQPTP